MSEFLHNIPALLLEENNNVDTGDLFFVNNGAIFFVTHFPLKDTGIYIEIMELLLLIFDKIKNNEHLKDKVPAETISIFQETALEIDAYF